jgi:hypothetical protein
LSNRLIDYPPPRRLQYDANKTITILPKFTNKRPKKIFLYMSITDINGPMEKIICNVQELAGLQLSSVRHR